MKRIMIISAVVILIAFSSNLHAQGVGLGIRVGANFANQSISNASTESITGFHGGAYLVLAFSEKWAIQPELLFSSQGSEVPDINEVKELDYFSIPVLLRYKPASFLSIEAGPQISSLLSAVNKSGDSIKDEFKNSDFGLALGTTVHLPLGLNAGLRYVWGFTNIDDLQADQEVKNKMFQIYVGWTFLGAN
jgi:hypothetical protein